MNGNDFSWPLTCLVGILISTVSGRLDWAGILVIVLIVIFVYRKFFKA
jgi:hypothetical protein